MSRYAVMPATFRRLLSPASTSKIGSTTAASRGATSLGAYVTLPSNYNSCQKRCYAAQRGPRAPAAPRAPKPGPGPSSGPSTTEIYDISSISFDAFADIVEKEAFKNLTATQYYDALFKFSEAIKRGAPPFSVRLLGDEGVPAPMMHEIGCILRHIPMPNAHALSRAMWASASDMGYRPSTLSLNLLFIRSNNWGKYLAFKKCEVRFKQIVSEGKDANALTVEGELLLAEKKYAAAERMLRRALQIGGPSFEWKPFCYRNLGQALLRLQRPAEAKEALLTALEGGDLDAEMDLGQLVLLSNPDEAEQYIYNAATRDRPFLFTYLTDIELGRSYEATDDKAREEHQRWATEWANLAGPIVDAANPPPQGSPSVHQGNR